MFKNIKEYIICSAIYFNDGIIHHHQPFNINVGFVIGGHRHHNCFMTAYILNNNKKIIVDSEIQGFLTNTNTFVDRKDAAIIAFNAGQILKPIQKLFSEDIY